MSRIVLKLILFVKLVWWVEFFLIEMLLWCNIGLIVLLFHFRLMVFLDWLRCHAI